MKSPLEIVLGLGSGAIFTTLVQLVKGKIAALYLGAAGVGVFNQITNIWNFIFTVSGLGLYNGVVRHVSLSHSENDSKGVRKQLVTSLVLATLFSIVVVIVSFLAWDFIFELLLPKGDEYRDIFFIVIICVPFAVASQMYSGLLSGLGLIRKIIIVQVLGDFVGLLVYIYLVVVNNLEGAALAFSLAYVIKLMIQVYIVKNDSASRGVRLNISDFDIGEFRKNIPYGITGMLMVGSGLLCSVLVARIIIDDLGLEANGLFSTAQRISGLYLSILSASVINYYLPVVSSLLENREIESKINEAVSVFMILLMPVVVLIPLFGEWLLVAIFSSEFSSANSVLVYLVAGDIFRLAFELVGVVFMAKKRLKIYASVYFAWVVGYVVLTFLMVDVLGLIGGGVAYLISYLTAFVLIMVLFKYNFDSRLSIKTYLLMGLMIIALVISILVRLASLGFVYNIGAVAFILSFVFMIVYRYYSFLFRLDVLVRLARRVGL